MKILNYISVLIGSIMYILLLFVFDIHSNILREIKHIYFLAIPCFMILISSFLTTDKKTKKQNLIIYLIIYLLVLVGFVFSNARTVSSAITNNIYHYNWNFIPFKSMIEMLNSPLGVTFGLYNIIGNFLMLTPLSILLPLINDKFKKTKIFLISIVSLTLFIEIVQFLINVGSFDIDDIILNIGGAFLLYLLIKRTKLKKIIEFIFLKFSIKKKIIGNLFYTLLFIVLLLISSFYIYRFVLDINSRKVDISKLVCLSDERTFITDYNNYHYYSNCNYGVGEVKIGNEIKDLENFLKSSFFNEEYEQKLGLEKEKIITDIKVKVNEDIGKVLVNEYTTGKAYWYNIESITVTKDGVDYDYREYLRDLEENKNTVEIDLSPLEETVYISPNSDYRILKSPYYQTLSCIEGGHLSGNPTYSYILSLDYEITSESCNVLNSLDEQ